uniref:DDE-1 domain-containing protein n=1 Tax=Tetranychus urticae TaxID=32264 RepID=T1KX86_TETUR
MGEKALICLKEPNGEFGPTVREKLFKPANLFICCTSSGKMTTTLMRSFITEVYCPSVADSSILMIDSWTGQRNEDLYKVDGKNSKTFTIPAGATGFMQQIDFMSTECSSRVWLRLLERMSTLHSAVKPSMSRSEIPADQAWKTPLEADTFLSMPFDGKAKDLTVDQLKALVNIYYNACTPDRFLVGYMNEDAVNFLRELVLPRVKVFIFGPRGLICQLHNTDKEYECALANTQKMMKNFRFEMRLGLIPLNAAILQKHIERLEELNTEAEDLTKKIIEMGFWQVHDYEISFHYSIDFAIATILARVLPHKSDPCFPSRTALNEIDLLRVRYDIANCRWVSDQEDQ